MPFCRIIKTKELRCSRLRKNKKAEAFGGIETPSVTPFVATGFFSLFYSMIFPLYIWWHYLIPIAIGCALFFLLRKVCKPRHTTVDAVFGKRGRVSGEKALKYAKVFLCLIIVFSLFYGGVRSTKAYYKMIVSEFVSGYAGESSDRIVESAGTLTEIAKKSIPEDETLLSLQKKLKISIPLADSDTLDATIPEVVADALLLCEKLGDKILTEEDAARVVAIKAQLVSDWRVVYKDSYNEKAQDYNKTMKTYPAKFFADIIKLPELPEFRAILEEK